MDLFPRHEVILTDNPDTGPAQTMSAQRFIISVIKSWRNNTDIYTYAGP